MSNVVERFKKYALIDTQANDTKESFPSNENELFLAEMLEEELKEIGVEDVTVDEYAFLYARIPSNIDKGVPSIVFLAHMDTVPCLPGNNINIVTTSRYDGGDIVLNPNKGIILSPDDYPVLKKYIGHDILTSDGTTVLGAEGKAGIAEIMEAVKHLYHHPEIKHGEIYICFTPDEELQKDRRYINLKKIPAKYGYTVDEGELGEINYENFNAATVTIHIKGTSIHPGKAKSKMINAVMIASKFISMLPPQETPNNTSGYEGYYHVESMVGCVEECRMNLMLRDFSEDGYKYRKNRICQIAGFLNDYYGEGVVKVSISDYYLNAKSKIEEFPELIGIAESAMKKAGIEPVVKPIRGGTYGMLLSFNGLPTPNIFSGCHNEMSPLEFISCTAMEKAVEVIINICKTFAEK